jgi:glutamate 5-kinase
VLDAGAVVAILQRRTSLLPAGIIGVSGDFSAGDPVELTDEAGLVVARGLVGFDSEDLPGVLGKSTRDLPEDLRREAVHRDDLIVI